jgi:Histone-like transcription factor (CBF/NF-Y) and archaeal histone
MLGIPLQFWGKQKRDMEWMMNFNSLEMPLVRVKRMMKSDDPLSRVAGNVTALFSKACEVFDAEKCHGLTWNANVGCNTIIIGGIGGFYGVSDSLPNPAIWQRIPGVLKGLNSNSTGTSIGDLSDDAGRTGWVGMRYHYMPVPMNLFPLMEKGEVSSPHSSGIFVPVYAPYGFLPYQPNQGKNCDKRIN